MLQKKIDKIVDFSIKAFVFVDSQIVLHIVVGLMFMAFGLNGLVIEIKYLVICWLGIAMLLLLLEFIFLSSLAIMHYIRKRKRKSNKKSER